MKTPYGKLAVPVADIRYRIEFATRIADDDMRNTTAAVARLGKDDFEVRKTASEELSRFGARAYPALLDAAQSDDPEVRKLPPRNCWRRSCASVPEADLEVAQT